MQLTNLQPLAGTITFSSHSQPLAFIEFTINVRSTTHIFCQLELRVLLDLRLPIILIYTRAQRLQVYEAML